MLFKIFKKKALSNRLKTFKVGLTLSRHILTKLVLNECILKLFDLNIKQNQNTLLNSQTKFESFLID